MFMITYILNGKKDSLCVRCSNIETAYESVSGEATILECEKLF
jgi:hypothetical protein